MIPNEKTTYIGRVADQKQNRASYIYNTLYPEMGLNALFLQFGSSNAEQYLAGIRSLEFRGSVVVGSLAVTSLQYLDDLDAHAKRVGAINTLVNDNGVIRGYKTDGPALLDTVSEVTSWSKKKVVILGAGKLAREIALMLMDVDVSETLIYNKTPEKAKKICETTGASYGGKLDDFVKAKGDILINVTHVGAAWCDVKDIFPESLIDGFETVMDATFSPLSTPLQSKAEKLGKKIGYGWRMFAHQGARQTKLFFDADVPMERLCEIIKTEFA